MSKMQGTFKRYEKKYLLNEEKFRLLQQKIQDKVKMDCFGRATICNIYFDTPDYHLIQASLEKPVYKEKLRLRSYGTPLKSDTVYIELKKKYNGIVYKRRIDMELSRAENYLEGKERPSKQTQITKEIDWVLSYYQNLAPVMFISYDRIAFCGIEDSNLRITFDRNILWRQEELSLESGVWGNSLLNEDQQLMEIKIPGAFPLWLSKLLGELEIYPISFSKYGRCYQQAKKNRYRKYGEKKYA